MHLGSLSPAPLQAEQIDFEWYGVTVRSAPNLSDLVLVDLMDTYGDIDLDDPATLGKAMSAGKSLARDIIDPADFDAFWKAAKANGASTKDVMGVAKALIEAFTGRPTMLPSDSSDGQSATPGNSARTPEWIVESVLPGRPDLQAAVLTAQRSA